MPDFEDTMREFAEGTLHSGSPTGPVVRNPKQAQAIAISEKKKRAEATPGLMATRNHLRGIRQASLPRTKRGSR